MQSVVTTDADGDGSLLSAAPQCKVLTRSPVMPLYSKNIAIKKPQPAGLFGFSAAVMVHKQQTAFHLVFSQVLAYRG